MGDGRSALASDFWRGMREWMRVSCGPVKDLVSSNNSSPVSIGHHVTDACGYRAVVSAKLDALADCLSSEQSRSVLVVFTVVLFTCCCYSGRYQRPFTRSKRCLQPSCIIISLHNFEFPPTHVLQPAYQILVLQVGCSARSRKSNGRGGRVSGSQAKPSKYSEVRIVHT